MYHRDTIRTRFRASPGGPCLREEQLVKVIQSSRLAFVIFLACAVAGMGLLAGEPALATGTSVMAALPGAAAPLATSGFGIQIVKATVQGPNGAGSNLPPGNPTGWATATVTCPAG